MSQKKIGVFVGSMRKESYNQKVAKEISQIMPENFEMKIINLGDLPIYNQDSDDDGTPPEAWKVFRNQCKELDGFLFVTPEHNRSVPALLKNALDVGSRPYGQSVWDGKPGAVVSASIGKIGGFGANHHLRQTMVFLNVLMLQQPEVYVGNVDSILDSQGKLNDEEMSKFLQLFANDFANWVEIFSKK